MAYNTENLDLYGKDPTTDGSDTFDITTMLNNNWNKIDAAWGDRIVNGSETVSATLTAGNWSGTVYSFEADYPAADWDLFISVNGSVATEAQKKAMDAAQVAGGTSVNALVAFGTVPTVNIPVVIRAVKK